MMMSVQFVAPQRPKTKEGSKKVVDGCVQSQEFIAGKKNSENPTQQTDCAVNIFTTQPPLYRNQSTATRKNALHFRLCPSSAGICSMSREKKIGWCLWFLVAPGLATLSYVMCMAEDFSGSIILWGFLTVFHMIVEGLLISESPDTVRCIIALANVLWFFIVSYSVYFLIITKAELDFVTNLCAFFIPTLILLLLVPCHSIFKTLIKWYRD